MKKLLLLLVASIFCGQNYAQTWQDTVALIDKIFERIKPANPGVQLAISRHGEIIFSKAWGSADLEHNIPLNRESIIEAGSVSKQFTAAAILLLEQQGKLSLNDDVRKYIPELPDYGTPITLRHMMQHVSGLKDWGSIASISGWPRSTKTYNNEDALYITRRQKTLNNKPGDEYIYSNTNYNLFAIIVERVSGKSLAEFTRVHIFQPAGMNHTEWRDNFKKIVPNRAIAYGKPGNNYEMNMPNEYVYGNGGLLTTAEDLLTWNNYYLNGKLGSPSLLSKQLATNPLNNGAMNGYAAGLVIDSIRGRKSITHSGATAGYRANLEYYPELQLSIAYLSNTAEYDRGPDFPGEVRNLLVKDVSNHRNTSPAAAYTVSQKSLDSYVGWYLQRETGLAVRLFIRDGKLANTRGGTMVPISENVFQLGRNEVEVVTAKPKHLLFRSVFDTAYLAAVDTALADAKSLQEYTGEYYSEEAETAMQVLLKDGRLIMHRDPRADMLLTPTYRDGFNFFGGTIHFERNKQNKIAYLKVFVNRARNVSFKKLR